VSGSFAGISVPKGDPGAMEGVARRLGSLAGQLRESSAELRGMPTLVGSWQGPASASYGGQCLTQSAALSRKADNYVVAAGAAQVFATELGDAREKARAAIADAREAKKRMQHAETELKAAKRRLADANQRIASAQFDLALGAAATDPFATTGAHDALRRAQQDADEAERDLRHWRREYQHAQDDLEQAQRRGNRAQTDAEDAAFTARAVFESIGGQMPALVLPAPPVRHHAKPDKPWWEDAFDWGRDQAGRGYDRLARRAAANPNSPEALDKGFLDGLAGMGQGAAALYRASQLNPNSAQRDRARDEMGKGLKHAWENPGQFGKSLIDWDDLSHGRANEAIGELLPGILGGIATGGSGTAASRGLKGTETAAKLAKDARQASHAAPAPRGTTSMRLPAQESFGNIARLEGHFRKHGGDFGAKSADDYARQASGFFQRSQRDQLPTKVDAGGIVRAYDPKSNTFGAFNPDGTTRTFFKPSSPGYFDRQPGSAPVP